MKEKVRSNTREDGFQREEDGGVGGWEMLLGPALDGEGGSRGQQTSDGQGNDEPRGEV